MAEMLTGRGAGKTGSGRGIGASVARLLAAEGARVVVNDNGAELDGTGEDKTVAMQVADEITAAGGEAIANGDDVGDFQAAEAIIQQAIGTYGQLDVLVNVAGIL